MSREVLFVICEMRGEIRMHSRNRCFKRCSEEYREQPTEKRAFLETLCFMSHKEEAFNDCSEQPVIEHLMVYAIICSKPAILMFFPFIPLYLCLGRTVCLM